MIKLIVLLTLSFVIGYNVAYMVTPKVPVINSCKAIPACFDVPSALDTEIQTDSMPDAVLKVN